MSITTRDNNFLKKLSENPNVAKVQYADENTIISNAELLKIFTEIKNLVPNSKTIFSRKFFSIDDILFFKKFNNWKAKLMKGHIKLMPTDEIIELRNWPNLNPLRAEYQEMKEKIAPKMGEKHKLLAHRG